MLRTTAELSGKTGFINMTFMSIISFPLCQYYYHKNGYGLNEFYDRAYRLRNNDYQLRIDRTSILSSFMGIILFYKKGLIFYGLSIGYFIGLIGGIYYNYLYYNYQRKMFQQEMQKLKF